MRKISEHKEGRTAGVTGWSARIAETLGALVLLAVLPGIVRADQSITLAWNQSPGTNVIGYNAYYGVASRTYTSVIDAGNATNVTVSGLIVGTTYYFAVTAYDALGIESLYSSEVSYTVPASTPVALRIRSATAGQFIVTVSGQVGATYQVLATEDFKTWTIIGAVTVPSGGSSDFTDTNAPSFPRRFYRTQ